MTRCYGRRKGRFNSFLHHQIRRDNAGPAGGDGQGRPVCHLGPALHQGTLWGEGARRRHVLWVQRCFAGFRTPRGTSHFPDIMGAQVTMSSWWSPWAPESLPRENGCHQGPAEVLGQRETPVGAGSALPASGVQLGRGGKLCPSNAASASARGKRPEALTEHHITGGVGDCFAIRFEPVSPARAVSPPEKSSCSLLLRSYTTSPEGLEIFPEAVAPDKASRARLGPALEQQGAA